MEENPCPPIEGFVDLLPDAVCVVDGKGNYVFVSAAFERIFGYKPAEVVGTRMLDLVAPEDRDRTARAARDIMAGNPKLNFENRYVRKDGSIVYIRWSARWSEPDQLRIAVAHDITERKQAELMQSALYSISEAAHAAEDLQALLQLVQGIIGRLIPATNFFVSVYDSDTDALDLKYQTSKTDEPAAVLASASAAFCEHIFQTGEPTLLVPDEPGTVPEHLRDVCKSKAVCWLGVPLQSSRDTIGALILTSYSGDCHYTEKDKALLQFVSTQIATSIERKQLQERLQYMAQYDKLTGLPNRGLLYDRLELALAKARREKQMLAALYMDLDNFKNVNDAHGHAAGDTLLREVGKRLRKCLRESDTVGRVGGDEFVVLVEDIARAECGLIVAKKIAEAISEPVELGGQDFCVRVSIGVAFYPENGTTVGQLLRYADDAMYAVKKSQL